MKKLLFGLVVQQWIPLYLLTDGSRVNRLWLGWVLSFSVLTSQISLMLGRKVPLMFWAVLMTLCRGMLSVASLQKLSRT